MAELDELLARFELGLTGTAEEAELARRLRADPAARRALVLHARVGAALARTPAAARPSAVRLLRRPAPWLAAAALLLAVGGWWMLAPASAPVWRLAGAAVDPAALGAVAGPARLELGGAASLDLADGGRLRVDGDGTPVLEAGTATVAAARRDPARPLVFRTAEATATIVGTRFRLHAEPAATRLEVDEGAVRFAAGGGALLVAGGQAALAAEGCATPAPPSRPAGAPPAAAEVAWRAAPGVPGWEGVWEAGGRLRAVRGESDTASARALVRSPAAPAAWTVAPGLRLRFACWSTGWPAGAVLRVMLKRVDLTNFAHDLRLPAEGWTTVELPLDDGRFVHLTGDRAPLAAGERIHAVALVALTDRPAAAARLWLRDLLVYRPAAP